MSSILENAYLRHRLRQMDQLYPEPTPLGYCDCTSIAYFALSVVMFAVGTVITIFALGQGDGTYMFSNLGHMWLVGPIFICSGLMVAVKSVLYLRRKSVIQMLLRQRTLLRGLQELAQQSRSQQTACVVRNASTVTLPPAYEALMAAASGSATEVPPPSYEEAMFLIGDEKIAVVVQQQSKEAPPDLQPDGSFSV